MKKYNACINLFLNDLGCVNPYNIYIVLEATMLNLNKRIKYYVNIWRNIGEDHKINLLFGLFTFRICNSFKFCVTFRLRKIFNSPKTFLRFFLRFVTVFCLSLSHPLCTNSNVIHSLSM